MRRLLLIPIVAAFAALLAGAHVYLLRRLVFEPGVAEPWRSALVAAVCVLGAAIVAQPLAERWLPPARLRPLTWAASVWMGVAFLLLLQLLASDALLWALGGVAQAAAIGDAPEATAGLRAAGVALLTLGAGLVALRSALQPPRLARVEIELPRWPLALDGFRIAQISDVHIGPLLDRRFARHVTERVNALDADLVAVTGDLVDGNVRHLAEEVAPFGELRGRHGVYFVTGNHDHYSGARAWVERVRALGMRPLRNERVEIRAEGARFDLVGVDDHRGDVLGREGGEDLDAALAGRDASRPAVLLAHDPSTFKRASGRGIDLQISGHTHGGQIWPFGALVRLAVPFVAGRHRRGSAELYVSRGTGFWGPPMRLFAPAEITLLVLRAAGRPA